MYSVCFGMHEKRIKHVFVLTLYSSITPLTADTKLFFQDEQILICCTHTKYMQDLKP